MGDARFEPAYRRVADAADRVGAIRALSDGHVVAALAAASRAHDPLLANVLATEALNRIRRLRAALVHLAEGVVTLDASGKITWANPAAERLLGAPRETLLGQQLVDRIGGVDAEGLRALLHDARERAASLDGSWASRADGQDVCLTLTAAPIHGAEEEPLGIVVTMADCTDRMRAQRQVEESAERYRSIFENTTDAISILTPDGTIEDANEAAVRLTGIPLSESVGRPFSEFIHEADVDAVMKLFAEVAQGATRRMALRVKRADGTDVLVDALGVPVVVGGKVVGVCGVARPVR